MKERNIDPEDFNYIVHRDWYVEWVKIPKYIATGSIGAIIFIFSTLMKNNNAFVSANGDIIRTCIILFGVSTILAFISIITSYYYFDFNLRLYLVKKNQNRGFDAPNEKSITFRLLAASNLLFAILAIVVMIVGLFYIGKLLLIFIS